MKPSKAELLEALESLSFHAPTHPYAIQSRKAIMDFLSSLPDEPAPSPEPYAYIAKTIGGGEHFLSADDAKQYIERDASLEPLYRHPAASPTKPEGLEWLVSALVSKTNGRTVTYGHRAVIITAEGEPDAKGQALDKFLVDGYCLESIDLKRVSSPVSDASDTVRVRETEDAWLKYEPVPFNMTRSTYDDMHHAFIAGWSARASLNGGAL